MFANVNLEVADAGTNSGAGRGQVQGDRVQVTPDEPRTREGGTMANVDLRNPVCTKGPPERPRSGRDLFFCFVTKLHFIQEI